MAMTNKGISYFPSTQEMHFKRQSISVENRCMNYYFYVSLQEDADRFAMKKKDFSEKDRPSPLDKTSDRVQGEIPTLRPKLAAAFKVEFNPAINDSICEKSPCVSFTTDETVESKQDTVPEVNERRKWRKATMAVAIASLIASAIFCAASFLASATTNSSAVLASALDTFLAIFSASVVIWRFRDDRNGKIGPKREKFGSIAFGVTFIIDSVVTIALSSFHLVEESTPKHSNIMWPALFRFSFVYCILVATEYWIFKRFKSSVLFSLAIDDAITSGLLFGLGLSALLMDEIKNLWYLDQVIAIGLALVIFACGIKILVDIFVYKGLPFQMFSSRL